MRWQATFDRLDALSRRRALTSAESGMLEHAIRQIDAQKEPAQGGSHWTPAETRQFRELIAGGCAIRAAARQMGRSSDAGTGKMRRMLTA